MQSAVTGKKVEVSGELFETPVTAYNGYYRRVIDCVN